MDLLNLQPVWNPNSYFTLKCNAICLIMNFIQNTILSKIAQLFSSFPIFLTKDSKTSPYKTLLLQLSTSPQFPNLYLEVNLYVSLGIYL